jgi:hypothetical protein
MIQLMCSTIMCLSQYFGQGYFMYYFTNSFIYYSIVDKTYYYCNKSEEIITCQRHR